MDPTDDDGDVISGVKLPHCVIEELTRLGLPLASYTRWQAESVRLAAVVDCRVVDDDAPDNPLDLDDMLELTDEESDAQAIGPRARITGIATAGVGGMAALPGLVGGFLAQMLEERVAARGPLPMPALMQSLLVAGFWWLEHFQLYPS